MPGERFRFTPVLVSLFQAFVATGTNLQLVFSPCHNGYVDCCDFDKERGKVRPLPTGLAPGLPPQHSTVGSTRQKEPRLPIPLRPHCRHLLWALRCLVPPADKLRKFTKHTPVRHENAPSTRPRVLKGAGNALKARRAQ
ncbi:hypothetical protein HPB51_025332 [Rhipicephalus microplus]|uniref:Secreted protein n=1 Tax=Rhipicephalus microplus TaxID=6941 RepID=A0A9J6DDU8_RHIMP|nr:hypothetical protein HPB51_025332 [Rhipicephalus microplus]